MKWLFAKPQKAFKALIVLVIISGIGIIFTALFMGITNFCYRSPESNMKCTGTQKDHKAMRQQITGLYYQDFENGHKILSIEAEKFTIERKKLGFFRCGLLNQARLEKGIIKFYIPGRKDSELQPNSIREMSTLLSKKVLSHFTPKRISSMVIAPARIEIYSADTLLSSITSDTAKIRITKRDILFQGNVKVNSGNKTLSTERLILSPKTGELKCSSYAMQTSNSRWKGDRITTDIFLHSLNSRKPS